MMRGGTSPALKEWPIVRQRNRRCEPTARRLSGCAVLALASAAMAGPDWEEGSQGTGDAGNLPGSAQVPKGQPPLTPLSSLTGSFQDAINGGDTEDMYLVYITDPDDFSAKANAVGARDGALADSQLWLFRADGTGLLGTDGPGIDAFLGPVATDGTGAAVTEPGLYYLAISVFDSDPVNIGGLLLFDQAVPGEISGPDGPGASLPIASWTGSPLGGTYVIELTGVGFAPCIGDVNLDGAVDVGDLAAVILPGDRALPVPRTSTWTAQSMWQT